MKSAAIIGGGLGGLAAACILSSFGVHVRLFEKNEKVGGKLERMKLGTYEFDYGPNTITMPETFKNVFRIAGENPDDWLTFIKLANHTSNHFPDGSRLDFSSDRDVFASEVAKFSKKDAANVPAFLKEVERLYVQAAAQFFQRTFTSPRAYASPKLGRAFLSVRPFQTMNGFFRKYFKHPYVLQALNRYATYIGSSPYDAPATFALISHLELNEGVFYVENGNARIAEQLKKLAEANGAEIYTNTEVTRMHTKNKAITSLQLKSGAEVSADEYILNGDLLSQYPELVEEHERPHFKNEYRDRMQASISAYVILAGAKNTTRSLGHHQVYFSGNYEQEFHELLQKQTYPKDPTVYVCNSRVTEPARAPEGNNLFILANAPALKPDGKEAPGFEDYEARIYDKLESYGLSWTTDTTSTRTPATLASRVNAYRGALYGPAANSKQRAFFRPTNAAKDFSNLHFAGGSTHPGGGSPMVVTSGMLVARDLLKQHRIAKVSWQQSTNRTEEDRT
ncbi:phytoene desaturase [Salsuginibacillus halophilus]|uniref:4,4'-diaponeurosporene oxygenase n=1 Tax=Salsuginibacillus halophilus TaxID=517424 RepID=A0A2P8HAM1_9BACI|nr:phytoene desaturase family protein [Salsuginibacillus halophilus]PSL43267.1 phytoene desaturase [Salsuginibacillus halophilus]